VSTSASAPPQGCHYLQPQRLSNEDECICDYDYSSRSPIASEEYSPSTMLASGNGASAAGGSGTAWVAGADSSAGGATFSATAEEGSSPSQDRSVDAKAHTIGRQSTSTTTTSTTREAAVLTSSTGLLSRPGHRGCWRCRPVHPQRAPPPVPCGYCLLRSSGGRRNGLLRS
jgi:hypothetical protein